MNDLMKFKIKESINPENYNQESAVKMLRFLGNLKKNSGQEKVVDFVFKKYGCVKILDSCVGDGSDAIELAKKGYEVTGNEIDKLFLGEAKRNIEREGVNISLTEYDWREFEGHFQNYDAILCLGNSICYLLDSNAQKKAIDNFYICLKKGGVLFIDERNFQYMLDHQEDINKGNFQFSGKYGKAEKKEYLVKPLDISDKSLLIEFSDSKEKYSFRLVFYPFKRNELLGLLREAGFRNIEIYSDYEQSYNSEADFYQYVCVK
ncbi:methyltransferase domain-containing protein [Candidatus Pacearchaeota archaeon]|nr:methyltransferase domain-containing protein [Candidatus Pacearchaeota archaeon]MBD3283576.1 methyltransferase domain-containing protein [Candidatus Pacearchaeota archaeon]